MSLRTLRARACNSATDGVAATARFSRALGASAENRRGAFCRQVASVGGRERTTVPYCNGVERSEDLTAGVVFVKACFFAGGVNRPDEPSKMGAARSVHSAIIAMQRK